ncbi:MAG: NosR/NirI family protein [Pseudomonadales bacterium]|nr:NosR/NirI family protein [Pseudomonadales bacterium]
MAKTEISETYPDADSLGKITDKNPIIPAYRDGQQIGYVFLNSDYVTSTGYSGKPIHMLIAIDMDGVLKHIKLIEHHEPIVLIGIPEHKITALFSNYIGVDIVALARDESKRKQVDAVSGATVTVMVMDDTIIRGAIRVARIYGLGGLKPIQESDASHSILNMEQSSVEDWVQLLTEGSVRRLKLTVNQVTEAFENANNPVAAELPESENGNDLFIELYAGLVSIPTVGRSLLGEAEYKNLLKKLKPGQQAVLVSGNGLYSFKGSGYVRGGIFDRFQIIQNDSSIRFHDYQHKRLRALRADGAPRMTDVDLFIFPEEIDFDPTRPWTVALLANRATGPTQKSFFTFNLENQTPERYLIHLAPEPSAKQSSSILSTDTASPTWKRMWLTKTTEIIFLSIALVILTVIFFAQQWLVKYPLLTIRVRLAFLTFVLVAGGWYANAQLSIVNILTMFNALVTGFDWQYFLMEPLTFILWGSVAVALIFWGRGPYCGWLCPFGALQELTNRIAKAFKTPQIAVPWWLHERLWSIKYILFLALFGLSLYSLENAERLAEIEPFKTAIIMNFIREWPYVLFAALMIVPGFFIERFYCRYLCPLGAALAIPAKLRMFEWLKRYKECGKPCQLCSNECMVQAIHPEGNINVHECLYCLHCHVLYTDDHKCPVKIKERKRHEPKTRAAPTAKPAETIRKEEMIEVKTLQP